MFRRQALVATFLFATFAAPATAGTGEHLQVSVDHARILKIDRPAATIIIGNPSIVDVTVHNSHTLVLTGRSYGMTNIDVLDRDGTSLIDEEVAVQSFETGTVRIYRQAERVTFACMPTCEPTVTVGDNAAAFSAASDQYNVRQSMSAGSDK